VSKKLAGIRLVPVELEIGGEAAAEGSKTSQQLVTPGFARDAEILAAGDMDFDLVAFVEAERFDDNGGQANRQTVSPFGNLHGNLSERYTIDLMYIYRWPRSRNAGLAEANLSAVVDEVMKGTPAVITRRGKKQAVVVSYQEWQRLSHVPSFGRLLIAAPLAADDLPKRNNMRGDD
jgi:antitoxin Phd